MRIKENIIPIITVPLLLFIFAVSYYRFIVVSDFIVSYEGECDPETATCYVDCEDEECTTEYYFTIVERHHNTIHSLCGENILECDAANTCLEGEVDCSVNYCDMTTEADFCETINENVI